MWEALYVIDWITGLHNDINFEIQASLESKIIKQQIEKSDNFPVYRRIHFVFNYFIKRFFKLSEPW